MFVANSNGAKILSEEGCTQGDNAGMAFYACNNVPLVTMLHQRSLCKQAWFVDDSAVAGQIGEIKGCWDTLNVNGPPTRYIPIKKNENTIEKAQRVFHGTGVNITAYGKKTPWRLPRLRL